MYSAPTSVRSAELQYEISRGAGMSSVFRTYTHVRGQSSATPTRINVSHPVHRSTFASDGVAWKPSARRRKSRDSLLPIIHRQNDISVELVQLKLLEADTL